MKKIKLIALIIVIISCLFILSGCTVESEAETKRQFTLVSDEGVFRIYYHNKTKVMYIISNGYYNYGTATVMLDAEGKPLLYEGE